MPKVSIVVPVYNVEQYLRPCVESVLSQTMSDWELLLVDDGSSDTSGAIIEEYAALDGRIRGIHQENAGAGAARNRGLEQAGGEYIAFLDSDDRYEPGFLAALLAALEREGADAAACGAVTYWENGSHEPERMPLAPRVLADREAVMEHFFTMEQGITGIWNKLYRRELIGDIRFRPYVRAQDTFFNFEVMMGCERCVNISDCLYGYLKREGSLTSESFGPRKMDVVRVWAEIYRRTKETCPRLAPAAARKTVREVGRLFCMGTGSDHPAWPEVRRELIATHNALYLRQFPQGVPIQKRLADAVFRISPELYFRISGGK